MLGQDWQLTDEEIDQAYCLADLHTDRMGHKAIARAAQKKLAEYMVSKMASYDYKLVKVWIISDRIWRTLLKELGV